MPNLILASSSQGVVLSLMAACFWAVSPICFASAGRRIGSLRVVVLRTVMASLLLWLILPLYGWTTLGSLPALPDARQFFWLAISALFGMAIGDGLIYEALVIIGPRRSTQILTLAPVAAIIPGWLWLGETLSWKTLIGVGLVLAGTSYAVLAGGKKDDRKADLPCEENSPCSPASSAAGARTDGSADAIRKTTAERDSVSVAPEIADLQPTSRGEPERGSAVGIGFAAAGALCVGFGAVAVRKAFLAGSMDVVAATAVRVTTAAVMLGLIPLCSGRIRHTLAGLRDAPTVRRLGLGVLAGPFLGMLCYIFAFKQLEAGLVSTMTATSPLFILPMLAIRYRLHIGWKVAGATALAIAGIACIRLQ